MARGSAGRRLFNIALIVGILVGIYYLIRLGWRGWRGLGAWFIPWWRATFEKPVLALLIRALELVDGDVVRFLLIVALSMWAVAKVSRGIMSWSVMNFQRQREAAAKAAGGVEDMYAKLRAMFADDVETIAFYERHLGAGARGGSATEKHSATRAQLHGCGGCLFTLLWSLVSVPLSLMVNVAIFAGVLRLFSPTATHPALHLSHAFPPTHYHGIALFHRSVSLTLLLVGVGLFGWMLSSISITGRTWPRPDPPWLWLILIPPAVILYLVLNGLLLLWTLVSAVIWLIDLLGRQAFRGPSLRLRALVARRQKPPEPLPEGVIDAVWTETE